MDCISRYILFEFGICCAGRLLTAMICEYLDWAQLNHTLKVYLPECNLVINYFYFYFHPVCLLISVVRLSAVFFCRKKIFGRRSLRSLVPKMVMISTETEIVLYFWMCLKDS